MTSPCFSLCKVQKGSMMKKISTFSRYWNSLRKPFTRFICSIAVKISSILSQPHTQKNFKLNFVNTIDILLGRSHLTAKNQKSLINLTLLKTATYLRQNARRKYLAWDKPIQRMKLESFLPSSLPVWVPRLIKIRGRRNHCTLNVKCPYRVG